MTAKPKDSTDWRAVWRLITPYWRSADKWKAIGLLLAIIALVLGAVYVNVLFNGWTRDTFDALQTKNYPVFKTQLWRFSYIAFFSIVIAIYRVYLTQALEMRWRSWMTNQYMTDWLTSQAYYRIEQTRIADNPDQRIAQDLSLLTAGTLSLSLGFLSSAVTLISFVGILWAVSGPLAFAFAGQQWTIPGYMVWFAVAYATAGSMLVRWIGKPLIQQNFNQQKFEADFRFGLIRIREYAEAIALYRGESREQAQLSGHFERIRKNWWAIMRTVKRINIASNFYAQFAIIFPLVVAAPRFFSGAITFGVLNQISDAFGQVQDALSWFINVFSSLAEWKASINRLSGFHHAITAMRKQGDGLNVVRNNVGAILLDQVALHLPDGQPLTKPFSGELRNGQKILVTGPSGCGKSTLFRVLAGIWPYGSGSVEIPNEAKVLSLPQTSYLPIGSLRAAIVYPAVETTYKDLAIQHYLDLCRLPQLLHRLDDIDNWSQRLSPGEQQRLAFVRALLTRPDVLFLDEATSALDADMEQSLYNLLSQELPQVTVMSIAHRESVAKFHQIFWTFTNADIAQHPIKTASVLAVHTIEISKLAHFSGTH